MLFSSLISILMYLYQVLEMVLLKCGMCMYYVGHYSHSGELYPSQLICFKLTRVNLTPHPYHHTIHFCFPLEETILSGSNCHIFLIKRLWDMRKIGYTECETVKQDVASVGYAGLLQEFSSHKCSSYN